LHKAAPDIESKKGHGTLAEPVVLTTGLELDDTIVLAAKGNKTTNLWPIASFNIATQELATLGNTDGIDSGCCREDWVLGKFLTDLANLIRDVTSKGSRAILVGVLVKGNDVNKSTGVDGFSEFFDTLHTIAVELVTQTVPNDNGEGSIIKVIFGVWCRVAMTGQSSYGKAKTEQRRVEHDNERTMTIKMDVMETMLMDMR
jgi:hypothetical protein